MSALLAAGCSGAPEDHGITVQNVRLQPRNETVTVSLVQSIRLSAAARRALSRGVTLKFVVSSELRRRDNRNPVAIDRKDWALSYLPLSEHYQVAGPDEAATRTFPRLRHAVRALENLEYTVATGELPRGDYEFRVRARLDRSSLPIPIQLPALLFSRWWHDSDWSQWPLKTNA